MQRPGTEATRNSIQSLFRFVNHLMHDGQSKIPIQLFLHVDNDDKGANTDIVSPVEVPSTRFPNPEPKKKRGDEVAVDVIECLPLSSGKQ